MFEKLLTGWRKDSKMTISSLTPPIAIPKNSERVIAPGEAQHAALTLAQFRDMELERWKDAPVGAQLIHLVPGAINILLLYTMQLEALCSPFVSKAELARELAKMAQLFEPDDKDQ